MSDRWILDRRSTKNAANPRRPYAFITEREYGCDGRVASVAAIFLTNNECPYRCLMCDLWKNTTDGSVAPGDIPDQIRWALDQLPSCRVLKLYNSGNFFDPAAIPPDDYVAIAEIASQFDTLVVESHPNMVGRRCFAFADMVRCDLHVAMGLETVQPEVLAALNKRMTLDDFVAAVARLADRAIKSRAFILLRPPFLCENEGVEWAKRSLRFAFDAGVECCSIIPTRYGNGALEALAEQGAFAPPNLDSLEEVFAFGLSLSQGRVFADLWDIEKFTTDLPNAAARIERLAGMNLTQQISPTVGSDGSA